MKGKTKKSESSKGCKTNTKYEILFQILSILNIWHTAAPV